MPKDEDREQLNIYTIPANYNDSGRMFGGSVPARNLVEVIIFAAVLFSLSNIKRKSFIRRLSIIFLPTYFYFI